MKPKIVYINQGGTREIINPTRRDIELMSRRDAIKRVSVFLPLAFFLGSRLRARGDSFIINRTISGLPQNAISMSNATWARPVTLPGSWTKIRLGCRMHMVNTGATLTGGPIFAMGYNSGTANQYGSASCQNFVGMAFDTANWTYTGSGTTFYNLAATVGFARTRVGTTNTDANLRSDAARPIVNSGAGTNSADRAIYFIDITKGSPNFTLHCPFTTDNGLGAPGDVSATTFLTYMAQLAPTPVEANYDLTNLSSPTLAVDEGANGTLNSINFFWNRADATLEICDVAAAVLA